MNQRAPRLSRQARNVLRVIAWARDSITEPMLFKQYNQTYPPIRLNVGGKVGKLLNKPLALLQMNEARLRRILTILEARELIKRNEVFGDVYISTTAKGSQALTTK